jgi:hypothetical protein
MDLHRLVKAVLAGDLLTARQWVADAQRSRVPWHSLPRPNDFNGREMSVAAALIELFARRAGEMPPVWTEEIGGVEEPVLLDPGLDEMPRSFERAKISGPEPLRRRNLLALPDFLDLA